MEVRLKVVPEPKSPKAAKMLWSKSKDEFRAFFDGGGSDNLICGQCGAILCTNVESSSFINIYLKCPFCEQFNVSGEHNSEAGGYVRVKPRR